MSKITPKVPAPAGAYVPKDLYPSPQGKPGSSYRAGARIYALRDEAAADVHAGIAAWKVFAGKANTVNGAGPVYFFNVEDATLSRLTPATATHLRSGLELAQLNTLGIEIAKAARFVFPDVFSRHKAVIGDGPGMHHPPVHAPVHPSLESIPHVPPYHVPERLDPKPTLVSHPLEEKIPKPPVQPPPSDGQVEFELEFNFWLGLGAFVVAGVGLALAFTAAPAVIALTVAGAVGGLVIAGLNLGLQAFKLFQFELEKAPPGGYFTPQGFVTVHGHANIAPLGTTGSGPGASGPGSAGGGGFGGTDGQGRPTLTAPVNQPNTSGPASSHPTGGGGVISPPQAPGTQPNHPDIPEIPDGGPPLPGGGGGGGGGGGQHPTVPEGRPQQPQDPIEDPPQNPTHPTEPPPTGPPEPPPTTPTPNDSPSSNPPSQPSQPHNPSAPAPPKTPNEPPEPPLEPEGGGGGGGIAAGSHPTISVNPSRGSSGEEMESYQMTIRSTRFAPMALLRAGWTDIKVLTEPAAAKIQTTTAFTLQG